MLHDFKRITRIGAAKRRLSRNAGLFRSTKKGGLRCKGQAAVEVIYKVLEAEKIYVSPRIANEAQQAFDKAKSGLAWKIADALDRAGLLRKPK